MEAFAKAPEPVMETPARVLASTSDSDSQISNYPNGSVPDDLLCTVPWSPSFQVYCPTLAPLTALNDEFHSVFGRDISFASGYRPGFAGRSFHGWGLAVDINGDFGLLRFDEPQFEWMMVNAPRFGWYLPFWAGAGGSNPEAWHWEFGSYYRGTDADFASDVVKGRALWIRH